VAASGVVIEGQHARAPKKFFFCIQITLFCVKP